MNKILYNKFTFYLNLNSNEIIDIHSNELDERITSNQTRNMNQMIQNKLGLSIKNMNYIYSK